MQKNSDDINFFLSSKKINGFTLVELIMVIVILGILSSFAIPKISNLIGTAEHGTINGAVANVKSAAGIAHTKWLIANNNPSSIDLEGKTIDMINGYPSANIATVNGNIAIASGLDDAEWEKTNPSTSNKMSITFKGYCFTYTEAATLGNEPSISSVQAAPCL